MHVEASHAKQSTGSQFCCEVVPVPTYCVVPVPTYCEVVPTPTYCVVPTPIYCEVVPTPELERLLLTTKKHVVMQYTVSFFQLHRRPSFLNCMMEPSGSFGRYFGKINFVEANCELPN